ncbi:MAG: aldehyde dehydrogenase family protein [archaeon]|nr:aldehyde dehydrogenase family protein [archaeon]
MKAEIADIMKLDSEYKLFIGGQWVPASDGATFATTCPATGEVLAKCAQATEADVDAAVKAAWAAFPAWSAKTAGERAAILNRIADIIDANAPRLAMIEALDKGSPLRETTFIDVPQTADHFRYYASVIRGEEGTTTQVDANTMAVMIHEPLGVVGQIVPWNFSLMIGAWKLAPALAAGNCVVFEPSSATSLSFLVLADLIKDVLPAGVFNLITGSGSKSGQYLLDHPDIKKLSFTGSTEVGYSVAKAAADKLIPATLELGGKSAGIFFKDCNIEKAVDGVHLGILFNQGEVCAACSRVLVQEDIYDDFLARSVAKFNRVNVGMPWEMTTQMASVIDEKAAQKIIGYIEGAKKEGARIACGGVRLTEGDLGKGCFIAPTIIEGTNDMTCAREEIFGPVVVFIKFKTEEEAIAIANDSDYGLAGAVWTQDINKAVRVSKAMQAGRVWINSCSNVPSGIAFGGYKKSGYGREINKMALDHYRNVKAIEISIAEGPSGFYPQ